MATQALRCERHGEATRLSCVDCGKPICPRCAVRTEVGLKCEGDARSIEVSKEALAVLRPSRTPLLLTIAGLVVLVALVAVLALRPSGDGDDAPAALPPVGSWTSAPDLATIRGTTTAVVLRDGTVLAAGGGVGQIPISTAELFDPSSGRWRLTGSMARARRGHAVAVLADGRVLVAGGIAEGNLLASAEIFDPASGQWSAAEPMNLPRLGHSLTTLADGRVLAAGGSSLGGAEGTAGGQTIRPESSAEIFDPVSGRWTSTSAGMSSARFEHTATLLDDGRVLIAGGQGPPAEGRSSALASTELFDPAVDTFLRSNDMAEARANHAAVKLADRSVLVVGGAGGPDGDLSLSTAEVFDPARGAWNAVGALSQARNGPTAALLADGRVLVAGGESASRGTRRSLDTGEVYTPDRRSWRSAGTMSCPRSEAASVLLSDGSALIVAGDAAFPGQQPEAKGCVDRYRP